MLPEIASGVPHWRHGRRGARKIAGQYPRGTGQQQQLFGRPDPFCLFAVVPMLFVTGLVFWGGLVLLGVVLLLLTALVVLVDAWINRPSGKPAARYREDYGPAR